MIHQGKNQKMQVERVNIFEVEQKGCCSLICPDKVLIFFCSQLTCFDPKLDDLSIEDLSEALDQIFNLNSDLKW